MKLYATTTSERASKGQGGNKYLRIEIMVFDRQNPLYTLILTPDELKVFERGYGDKPRMYASHKDIREQYEVKGKKQKGERCDNCGKVASELFPDRDDDGWKVCQNCL